MPARTEYETRLAARQQTFDRLRNRDDQAVHLRTAIFLAGILVVWVVLGPWQLPWQFLLIPAVLFIAALFYHESIKRKQRVAQRGIDYYERCLQRLDGQWSGVGPTGDEFLDPLHHYAGDLDIFGEGSLFQLMNSPVTPSGANTLAGWLARKGDAALPTCETVVARQRAVSSLSEQLDLRERLAVIGSTKQSQQDAKQLREWLSNPGGLTATWIRVVGILLGIIGLAALGYFFASLARGTLLTSNSTSILILVAIVQLIFLYRLREPLDVIKKHSEHAVFELHRIVQVVEALETVAGEDDEIRRLRAELTKDGLPASATIRSVQRDVSQFENMRHNLFIAPLALMTMTNLHFACAIDRWRTKHGPHVDRWFSAVGELEALLAFSQLHYENPDYSFPELSDGDAEFVATQIAHPLLPSGTAIANDIELSDDCRLLLISGSNMSGKSTCLRSVGINAALAWAGAPVFAKQLKLARLNVAAAMRMQDSLQSGTSHFFAELKRIQLVVEMAENSNASTDSDTPHVLFLLDEILHGTNSHDRLVGAKGVIQSLLQTGALGLVTTHDLTLAEMVTELKTPAHNVHFRDEWVDGKMTFDYRMRDGVVPKSNALSLMRLLGLDV